MESTVNTFTKGLNRDVSPTKYSPENYYDALNVKLVADTALSSFSLTNELGNSLKFRFPTVQAVYELTIIENQKRSISIVINGEYHYLAVPTTGWTYALLYAEIISKFSSSISLNHFIVSNQLNRILITGLNVALTITGDTTIINITELIPQLTSVQLLGHTQLRNYLILITADSSTPYVSNGQFWKLEIEEGGTVKDIGTNSYLVASAHLIYNEQLNLSTSHRIEAYSNYETSEVGKIYLTDNNSNFRHFNVLDPLTFSIPLSTLDIVPEVTFGTTTIESVTDTGTYTSGMVQYAHQYYNVHGSQSSFSPSTGLIHLLV